MASRSKRRRRVLGASCILAALIIAGSSFAWFTSKDEVTNRLTANADYDVSIVESFAAPTNWLPGDEVNKDVYAINTGSIGAFVNEDVSGVLTYTAVKKVATFVAADADEYVKLTADEVDVMKAGAFLAGAFDENGDPLVEDPTADPLVLDPALGDIAEYFNNGPGTNPKTTDDFTPAVEGLYIFRRSIKVGEAAPYAETFTYAGYYFDGTDYYKLDEIKTNSYLTGNADDGLTDDGVMTKAPEVIYLKEVQAKAVPTLTYEPAVAGEHGQRLVAVVSTGADATGLNGATIDGYAEDADTKLKLLNTAKENLDTAKQNLEDASSAYQVAVATIAYYAGEEYAETITAADLGNIDEATDFSAGTARTADKVVANGVTKTKLDQYNAALAEYNTLIANPVAAADPSAMNTAKDDLDDALAAFEAAKAAYLADVGYEYTRPVTAPAADTDIFAVWEADNDYRDALATYETAKATYDAAVAAKATYDASKASYEAQLASLSAAIVSDVQKIIVAIGERDTENPAQGGGTQSVYDAALAAYNTALGNYENALATYNEAAAAYQVAVDNDTQIVIYINLSDDVITDNTAGGKWLLADVPAGAQVAHFYYTSILASGTTSAKLIDSVTLSADTTQNDYKSFDFDLNIGLDSAQIAYDKNDGKTLVADATKTDAFDGKKADLVTPTSTDSVVIWTDYAAP